jgi:hypothetical protein
MVSNARNGGKRDIPYQLLGLLLRLLRLLGKACACWEYLLEAVLDDGGGLPRSAALMADFGTTSAGFAVGCGGPSACERPCTADQEVAS